MAATDFDRVVEQVSALTPAEQWRLLDWLEVRLGASRSEPTEERLEEELGREELITTPPPPTAADVARFRDWKPIPIPGKPLSETIIEERR